MKGKSKLRWTLCFFLGIFIIPWCCLNTGQAYDVDKTGAIQIGDAFGVVHGAGTPQSEVQFMVHQGIQITRNDFTWTGVEREAGNYSFIYYDWFVHNLSLAGIDILAVLDYGNEFLFGDDFKVYISPIQIPAWLEFVNRTVTRYQNYVYCWEIWNEPQLDCFWMGTDQEYFTLLETTAELIYDINNSLKISTPGISGHDPEYFESMINAIGETDFNRLFDVMSFHPYSGSTNDVIEEKCRQVHAVADAHGFTGELWVSEVGYDTTTAWRYQAEQLVKTYAQTLSKWVSL